MILILEIACGIALAVAVLNYWREIGAIAAVAIGATLLIAGVGSMSRWDFIELCTVAAFVGLGAWLHRRNETQKLGHVDEREAPPHGRSQRVVEAADSNDSAPANSLRHLRNAHRSR